MYKDETTVNLKLKRTTTATNLQIESEKAVLVNEQDYPYRTVTLAWRKANLEYIKRMAQPLGAGILILLKMAQPLAQTLWYILNAWLRHGARQLSNLFFTWRTAMRNPLAHSMRHKCTIAREHWVWCRPT